MTEGTKEAAAPGGLWRYGAALRHGDYRRYWLASTLSGSGNWGLIVARGWVAYQSSGSALAVGVATFSAMLPWVLVPPFAGLLADRMDRRKIVAWAHFVNVLLAMVLLGLWWLGVLHLWQLTAISFLSGGARGFGAAAGSALAPNLVPRSDLLNAIVLNNISLDASRVVGPFFVGLLLTTPLGEGASFVLMAVLYVAAALLILQVRTASTGQVRQQAGFLANLTEGLVYAVRHRAVGLIILLVALHCSLTMAFESVLPLHADSALHAERGTAFSNLIVTFGLGALVGAGLIAGIRTDLAKGRALLVAGLGSSLSVMGLAFAPVLPVALGASFVMGMTQAPFMALAAAFIQTAVPDAVRGRVSSLYVMCAVGLMAVANLGYGFLADLFGSRAVLAVPPLLFFGVIVLALLGVPTLRTILLRGFGAALPARAPAAAPAGAAKP